MGGDWGREIAEEEGLALLRLGAGGSLDTGAHFGGIRVRAEEEREETEGRNPKSTSFSVLNLIFFFF